jgi:protein required for attachment to host cells
MKLAANMWVAVIDGARGIILVNEGTAIEPRLVSRKTYHQDNPSSHEQGNDRPGRVHESVGHSRSGVEMPDLHQKAEDRFVNAIIADLEKEAATGAFQKIVIIAPPIALGVLRKHIGAALKPHIAKEIAADYTKMPVAEITAAVVKALEG